MEKESKGARAIEQSYAIYNLHDIQISVQNGSAVKPNTMAFIEENIGEKLYDFWSSKDF